MKRILTLILGAVCALGCCTGCGEGDGGIENGADIFPYWQIETNRKTDGQYYFDEDGYNPQFPDALWQTPAAERYPELDHGNVKAYFIDSVQNTKVFCYVGIPQDASADNKVPAVVLVHGATGTAFYDWVQMWNDCGYAAIAMDTEGRMPGSTVTMYNINPQTDLFTSIKEHGPVNQAFGDSYKPTEQQWVYHALSSVIASASFIKSFEEVDGGKIGITGVSYGGFLTSLAVGYDDRFSFGAPVYGCIANEKGACEFGQYIKQSNAQGWDGTGTLKATRSVMLFTNSNHDMFFSLKSSSLSAAACKQSALCIKPDYSHGHYQGAKVKEVFDLADEIFRGGVPLVHITDTSNMAEGEIQIAVPKGVIITKATQYYSVSDNLDDKTVYGTAEAEVSGNYVFFSPMNYKYQYIQLEDDKGRTATTAVFEQ